MLLMPYYMFFSLMLFIGTFISLSSMNWVYIWVGLEINLLAFIPMISCSNADQETEAAVKYFLIQAMGSGLMLMGVFSYMYYPLVMVSYNYSLWFFMLGLFVKMGVFPCYFWFPQVMFSLSWLSSLVLATWQKMASLFLFSGVMMFSELSFIMILVSLNSLVGGFGGLNQTYLRPLLAYSSIGHMGWMLSIGVLSVNMLLLYYLVYVIVSIPLFFIFMVMSSKSNQMSSISGLSFGLMLCVMILLLSLGGLPPLLGFLPKWLVIQVMMSGMIVVPLALLIIGSLMNLFYYLAILYCQGFASLQGLLILTSSKYFSAGLWPLYSMSGAMVLLGLGCIFFV